MKKILITGSAGFVGSHLVDYIIEKTDWKIIGIDSFKHRGDSMRLQNNDRYEIITHDLSTPISHRLIDKIGYVDYIVNMASESHVDRSIDHPVPFIQNNVNLVLNVLEMARTIRPAKFIQISTDEVYGPALDGIKHKEWATILPSNPYAASKAAQEAICISYWRTYGVPLIITNTMNMFGERQDPEKYIPMLISKISRGETVTVHGSEYYIGKRFYLHARNHADALLFLLEEYQPIRYEDSESLIIPSRFNIVGEREVDNLQLARLVADFLGKDLHYELQDFHKTRPGHDRRYALSDLKLSNQGWVQPMNFEESLRRVIKWTTEHTEWMR